MDIFVCSNPKCNAVHDADPQGHCPTCVTADGVGYSTMRRTVQHRAKLFDADPVQVEIIIISAEGQEFQAKGWVDRREIAK